MRLAIDIADDAWPLIEMRADRTPALVRDVDEPTSRYSHLLARHEGVPGAVLRERVASMSTELGQLLHLHREGRDAEYDDLLAQIDARLSETEGCER